MLNLRFVGIGHCGDDAREGYHTRIRDKYAQIRGEYAANTRQIRGWIRRNTRRIRANTRVDTHEYARIRMSTQEYAQHTRTGTHEYARIRTDTLPIPKVRMKVFAQCWAFVLERLRTNTNEHASRLFANGLLVNSCSSAPTNTNERRTVREQFANTLQQF